MNPKGHILTKTSAGLETPQQTMQRARAMVPTNGFTVNVPDTIPAESLNGNFSLADVRTKRGTLETAQMGRQQFDTDYNNLMARVQAPLGATPFANPQQFIEQTLLRRPSEVENQLDTQRQEQAANTRALAGDITETRNQATEQFGLPQLQTNLAETRNRISERTVQLRQTLRDFETNAQRRGVAREFVESEKQAVQAEAAAELADLAIIESAQLGNVQMAQQDIDRAVNAKIQAFEIENQAIQQEITRLESLDSKEAENRKQMLEIALGERNRNIEQAIADEKQKLTFLSEAAANGADQGTLDAIRKAASPSEAAMVAGPFIGRLDRMQAEANIANTYSQITDRKERLQLAKDAALLDDNTAAEAGLAENEVAAEKALGMFSMLKELSVHPGFSTAVGPNVFARGLSPQGTVSAFFTGDRSEFRSIADQIANTLTLDNMDKLKGPATDKDVELVANSVSKLKNFDLSQEAYQREITRIADAMKRIAIQKGVSPDQLQFYGLADENQISEFDQLWNNSESTQSVVMSSQF